MNTRARLLPGWPVETWLFLSGSVLALAVAPIASELASRTFWIGILATGVAFAGLPHGALDPWIAYRAGVWRHAPDFVVFNLAYLLLACALALLWWTFPALALALFLAYATWHFSADWRDTLDVGWRLVAGIGLIALPAVFHEARVNEVFSVLAGSGGQSITAAMAWAGPAVIGGYALATVAAIRRAPRVGLELATIALLAFALPPLAYFAVYFCLLHSSRHLRHHVTAGEAGERRLAAMIAIAYTIVTLLLAAILWYAIGANAAIDEALLRVVFIGLAALTVPHMALTLYLEHRGEGDFTADTPP